MVLGSIPEGYIKERVWTLTTNLPSPAIRFPAGSANVRLSTRCSSPSLQGLQKEHIIFIIIIVIVTMLSVSVAQVFLMLAVLQVTASLPVRDEGEVDGFLTPIRLLDVSRSLSRTMSGDALLEARLKQLLAAGLDRRRQLGDLEFSNRYSEFLRSKAKHSSICALLRRMQGVKKSGEGADTERVNLLLSQYMCPSVYNAWPTDL